MLAGRLSSLLTCLGCLALAACGSSAGDAPPPANRLDKPPRAFSEDLPRPGNYEGPIALTSQRLDVRVVAVDEGAGRYVRVRRSDGDCEITRQDGDRFEGRCEASRIEGRATSAERLEGSMQSGSGDFEWDAYRRR